MWRSALTSTSCRADSNTMIIAIPTSKYDEALFEYIRTTHDLNRAQVEFNEAVEDGRNKGWSPQRVSRKNDARHTLDTAERRVNEAHANCRKLQYS